MELEVPSSSGVRRPQSLRLLAALVAILSLIAGACSDSSSRSLESPTGAESESLDPNLGRTASDGIPVDPPGAGDATEFEDLADTSNRRTESVVHVIGSVRATPTDEAWETTIPLVNDDLATIASVNCNLGDDCDIESIADWAAGRVDIVNLATAANVLSTESLTELQSALEDRGVASVGFGPNRQSAQRPFVFVSEDVSISVHAVSLTAIADVEATDDAPGIAGPQSFEATLDAIAASRDAEQGVVVVIDWGGLDDRAPSAVETDAAEQLIDAGANAIIGHGSDFLQRFDQVATGVVAYGLGNAVPASAEPLRRDTSVLRLEFDRPGTSCLLPATATEAGPSLDDEATLDCSN